MSDALGRLLAHPLRQWLLHEYERTPAHPAEVARRLGEPLNLVAYHTGVLARAGLLAPVRTERHRGGLAHYYRSAVGRAIGGEAWVALAPQLRRALVRGSLATLEDETRRAVADGGFDARHVHVSRWPMRLDETAIGATDRVLRELIDDLAALQERADRRRTGARSRVVHVALLGFASGRLSASAPPADPP